MNILIKNGRIIDPSQNMDKVGDLLVEKGRIIKVGQKIKAPGASIVDAENKIIAPGFIDMHTHLREPGREEAETIVTGLQAAIVGGFTTVSAMPNTEPACDKEAHVRGLFEKAREARTGNLLPVGTITSARKGEIMSEMAELKEAGCLAISDDGASVSNAEVMRKAMEYASMVDLLVVSHCEDKTLAGDGVMHEGKWSTILGLAPIPGAAESIVVERDIRLAEITGARLHIAHISTEEAVAIVRRARKKGIPVSAEVTPHHIALSDEDLKGYNTNMKVNPPLRTKGDIKALKQALADGVIEAIATDHAPHPEYEKEKEFNYAPFGMIGLETALSIAVESLLDEGYLDWAGLISKLSTNPARLLKYDRGTLKEGGIADITIIDPGKEWVYEKSAIRSRACNSPFLGKKMKAKVTDVLVGGKIVLKEGRFA